MDALEKQIRWILDTRHTVPAGQSYTDTYAPRLAKLIQQEIAKAQIRILKQEQSWIEDVNRDIGWSIRQTIDGLSKTLKEHKDK